MGINYIFANVRKREYFDPHILLDNSKSTGYLSGLHPPIVTILCCKNIAGFDYRATEDWNGRWFGDPVYVVGDGSSAVAVPDYDGELFGSVGRIDFSFVLDEYEDISLGLLAAACRNPDLAAKLAGKVASDPHLITPLGNLVFLAECEELRRALETALGPGWVDLYNRAFLSGPNEANRFLKNTKRQA